jgi:hypothetical protein
MEPTADRDDVQAFLVLLYTPFKTHHWRAVAAYVSEHLHCHVAPCMCVTERGAGFLVTSYDGLTSRCIHTRNFSGITIPAFASPEEKCEVILKSRMSIELFGFDLSIPRSAAAALFLTGKCCLEYRVEPTRWTRTECRILRTAFERIGFATSFPMLSSLKHSFKSES